MSLKKKKTTTLLKTVGSFSLPTLYTASLVGGLSDFLLFLPVKPPLTSWEEDFLLELVPDIPLDYKLQRGGVSLIYPCVVIIIQCHVWLIARFRWAC